MGQIDISIQSFEIFQHISIREQVIPMAHKDTQELVIELF